MQWGNVIITGVSLKFQSLTNHVICNFFEEELKSVMITPHFVFYKMTSVNIHREYIFSLNSHTGMIFKYRLRLKRRKC